MDKRPITLFFDPAKNNFDLFALVKGKLINISKEIKIKNLKEAKNDPRRPIRSESTSTKKSTK
jgi:hypothetical protein